MFSVVMMLTMTARRRSLVVVRQCVPGRRNLVIMVPFFCMAAATRREKAVRSKLSGRGFSTNVACGGFRGLKIVAGRPALRLYTCYDIS